MSYKTLSQDRYFQKIALFFKFYYSPIKFDTNYFKNICQLWTIFCWQQIIYQFFIDSLSLLFQLIFLHLADAVWLFWLWIVFFIFNLVADTNSKWGLHRNLVSEPHNLLKWWQVQVDVGLKTWDQAWGYVFQNIWHWEI